jgi:hypothetical protein
MSPRPTASPYAVHSGVSAKLAAISFGLALAGLLLAEVIARRMHRLLGRA